MTNITIKRTVISFLVMVVITTFLSAVLRSQNSFLDISNIIVILSSSVITAVFIYLFNNKKNN